MKRSLLILGVVAMLQAACGGAAGGGPSTSSTLAAGAAARAELAPSGTLRVGFPAAPPFLGQRDPGSGRWKGLAVALGTSLAAALGVPMTPMQYADPGKAYQALQSGDVDVVMAQLQAKPDAAAATEAVVRIEHTYLVRSNSPLHSISDVDRVGIRVGSADAFLASQLRHAQLIGFATDAEGLAALASGRIDAYAGLRFALEGLKTGVPGSRILDGTFFTPGLGFATLSSHVEGTAFLDSFVASQLSSGTVQRDVDAIGRPGVLAGPAA